MKTRTLLLSAAALVAGLMASQAQTYSVNTVGYVNTVFENDTWYMVANPLIGSPNNNLSTIMPGAPIDAIAFAWVPDAEGGNYGDSYQSLGPGAGWAPDAAFAPGAPFILYSGNSGKWTNTFVGDVDQTSHTNVLVNGFQLVSSVAPIAGGLDTVLAGMPADDGDSIFTFINAAVDFDGYSSKEPTGWLPNTTIGVAQAVMYFRNSNTPSSPWIRQFTVQ